jgi:hypothetical protein
MLMEQLPKLIGALGLVCLIGVIGHRELRTEKKITDGVFVKDAVDQDPLGMALKVNPVIPATETVKGASIPLDFAEIFSIKGVQVFGEHLKLREKIELEVLGQGTHFGGADGVEDDLEHGREC